LVKKGKREGLWQDASGESFHYAIVIQARDGRIMEEESPPESSNTNTSNGN